MRTSFGSLSAIVQFSLKRFATFSACVVFESFFLVLPLFCFNDLFGIVVEHNGVVSHWRLVRRAWRVDFGVSRRTLVCRRALCARIEAHRATRRSIRLKTTTVSLSLFLSQIRNVSVSISFRVVTADRRWDLDSPRCRQTDRSTDNARPCRAERRECASQRAPTWQPRARRQLCCC